MPRQRHAPAAAGIEPRKRPRQERSLEMVERILDTARQLANETGIKGMSTAKIAARAGLSIGSLYQYFPNKESIVLELARRWLARFRTVLDQYRDGAPPRSWRAFSNRMRAFLREIGSLYRESSDMLPVLELLAPSAELRHVEIEHDRAIVESLVQWFRDINPRLSREAAARLGLLLLEAGHACFKAAATQMPGQARQIQADLETMMLALLRPHLALR
jgi:AcrR family transcriptional regulator